MSEEEINRAIEMKQKAYLRGRNDQKQEDISEFNKDIEKFGDFSEFNDVMDWFFWIRKKWEEREDENEVDPDTK
jgi:hypothetical protein